MSSFTAWDAATKAVPAEDGSGHGQGLAIAAWSASVVNTKEHITEP